MKWIKPEIITEKYELLLWTGDSNIVLKKYLHSWPLFFSNCLLHPQPKITTQQGRIHVIALQAHLQIWTQ